MKSFSKVETPVRMDLFLLLTTLLSFLIVVLLSMSSPSASWLSFIASWKHPG